MRDFFFFENLRNPARVHRADAMRQIPTTQLDSSEVDFILLLRGMILLLST
jgi:hypothetical protein